MRTYDIINAGPNNRFMANGKIVSNSGHDAQLHNMPRPTKVVESNLQHALDLLEQEDYLGLELDFPSVMDVIAGTIRSMFQASAGKKLVVCDLGAIENRVLGWVAGCDSILKVFRDNLDPYKSFAVEMYNKPYEEITKQERQDAKPAVLGCGYQLAGGEEKETKDGIIKTGLWGYAHAMGVPLTQEQAHRSVQVFRDKYVEVVQLWYNLEAAALAAIRTHEIQVVGPVTFQCFGKKLLRILLPSGRGLHYIRPRIIKAEFSGRTKDTIVYEGLNQKTRQWVNDVKTYGGKLAENITQAIARDLLLNSMFLAEEKGLFVVGHIHDELICEVPEDSSLGIKELRECMITNPSWAPDLPLGAEGYEAKIYRKG